jgi:predicted PurR-regulated permease PerM
MNNKQIVRLVTLWLALALVYFARGALLPIVLALILFYALHPLVRFLNKLFPKKFIWGKDLSIITSFAVFIALCFLVFEFVVPSLAKEFSQFSQNLPQFIEQLRTLAHSGQQWYTDFHLPPQIDLAVSDGLNNTFRYFTNFFQRLIISLVMLISQFVGFIVIPVIVYYLLKDDDKIQAGLLKLIPKEHQKVLAALFSKVNYILRSYVEGQIVICSVTGIATGLGLYFLGIKFFLVLGLIAAITELIPIIGPVIGAIPAIIIAFLISPSLATGVIIFYLVIQTIIAYILIPKLMGNKLDLHPMTILIGVLILGSLIGAWGIFFAAPLIAIAKVLYLELRKPN